MADTPLFSSPVPEDNPSARIPPGGMRQILTKAFNEIELRNLCCDMQIDYDSLPGSCKADKARELVLFCQRHDQYQELVKACQQLRPKFFQIHSDSNMLKTSRPRQKYRIFISRERNADLDEQLARYLSKAFEQAGHKVFIDQTRQTSVQWAKTIEQQIASSDFMVILLSPASAYSETVTKEVEYDYKLYQLKEKAYLLPVRVNYNDALPYQLTPYLSSIPYTEWHSEADNEAVSQQLLAVISGSGQLVLSSSEPVPTNTPSLSDRVPKPYADPRFVTSLSDPNGAIKYHSEFYVERDSDLRLRRELSRSQAITVTIRAPRQTGKTSLLIRGKTQAEIQQRKVILFDLQATNQRIPENLDAFLYNFTLDLCTQLRLDQSEVSRYWQSGLGSPEKTTSLIEDYILPQANNHILLAMDEVDRLLHTSFQDSFFGLLRSWHNRRAMNQLWEKLDIVMVISTEPHLLIKNVAQSPFNVGTRIVLEDFTLPQIAELNGRYRSPLNERKLPALLDFLGGHPYLTSKALYTLIDENISWEQMVQIATTSRSPFDDHLRRYLFLLQDQRELKSALKQIISHGRCSDEKLFDPLLRAGLIRGTTRQSCSLRCQLYADYFKDKL